MVVKLKTCALRAQFKRHGSNHCSKQCHIRFWSISLHVQTYIEYKNITPYNTIDVYSI